jgi:hypothetical protein
MRFFIFLLCVLQIKEIGSLKVNGCIDRNFVHLKTDKLKVFNELKLSIKLDKVKRHCYRRELNAESVYVHFDSSYTINFVAYAVSSVFANQTNFHIQLSQEDEKIWKGHFCEYLKIEFKDKNCGEKLREFTKCERAKIDFQLAVDAYAFVGTLTSNWSLAVLITREELKKGNNYIYNCPHLQPLIEWTGRSLLLHDWRANREISNCRNAFNFAFF